ncbi:hypothetical protein DW674_06675 [Mitsuokella multacida]|uniref:Uncharacterized protein n=1 Tax=Mitsuokella multacida TaxID=52226 RepID=A0A414NWB8_9FIRM|nr:hypothetical protein DW674_06675 [Mitsuokella multacida]
MRVLSCGAKSPRDCFNCPFADCTCNDMSTAEEGKWMRLGDTKRKTNRAIVTPAVISNNDTTVRAVKSNVRRNNYEFLFY